jgi:hypothetical protein
MRAIYLAEKVTTQLIGESDIVPIAPTPFIRFPFKLDGEDLAGWQVGIPFESRVNATTAFEDYQETFMLPLWTTLSISLDHFPFSCYLMLFVELTPVSNSLIG